MKMRDKGRERTERTQTRRENRRWKREERRPTPNSWALRWVTLHLIHSHL
jgi:hypothetical protein